MNNTANNIARFVKAIILIVAVVSLGSIVKDYVKGFYDVYKYEVEGTETKEGVDVVVTIPEGASAEEIANILKDKGLIQYPKAFIKRLQDSEYRGRLRSGTYTLNTGMTTLDMMAAMCPAYEEILPIDQLVIPEGFTIEMIAERCEEQGICSADEFLREVSSVTSADFPYMEDIPAGIPVKYKLQGYIFPATYDIYEDTTAKSLVEWMLETFDNYYTEDMQTRAAELGYSSFDVVTRASIVEREAKVATERATIAGVINNRLNSGMNLEMCPTVLYPLTDGMYDQSQVLYEDLSIESEYTTYLNSGLPVGPICNPGLDCINAVLYPEQHSYYFYHVDDEEAGTHIFTETYEEHIDTQIIGGPNGIPVEGEEETEGEE